MQYRRNVISCKRLAACGDKSGFIQFICNLIKRHRLLALGLAAKAFDLPDNIRGNLRIGFPAFTFAIFDTFSFSGRLSLSTVIAFSYSRHNGDIRDCNAGRRIPAITFIVGIYSTVSPVGAAGGPAGSESDGIKMKRVIDWPGNRALKPLADKA